jgi:DNA polymerase-4
LIAQEIRRLIQVELNLTASAGIAPNKFLAKIASDWKKPNGQFVIRPEEIAAFVEKLPVEKIYGVGKVTAQKMHGLGLITCADIQKQSIAQLEHWFGSRADELYDFSRGIDDREVHTHWERKSLSVEQTFDKDLQTWDECAKQIPELFEDWRRRIENGNHKEKIKSIVVKLKFSDFKATTHEEVIHQFPKEEDFYRLLQTAWNRRASSVRLIGIGVHMGDRSSSRPRQTKLQLQFAI